MKNKIYPVKIALRLLTRFSILILLSSCFAFPSSATPFTTYSSPNPVATPTIENIYFVDGNLGSDLNPGSQAKPWQTIQKAADMISVGDTVMVLSGTYPERVDVEGSGLSFIAQGVVNMQGFEVAGNNNLIRGFTIQNPNNNSGIASKRKFQHI